jgi:chromosome segregation ATPase
VGNARVGAAAPAQGRGGRSASSSTRRARHADVEVERRLAHVLRALARARARWHEAQRAVREAESVLAARMLEREEAAIALADLADLADSLQHARRPTPSRMRVTRQAAPE